MADLKVEVFKIATIKPHPNADRMELAYIGGEDGWQTCVKLGEHKKGDVVVYFPVDSILPEDVETIIFGPESKVTLHKHRVRSIKLRGAISQGFVVPLELLGLEPNLGLGTDVAEKLGITKYEPPVKGSPQMQGTGKKKMHKNPHFKEYTSINHFKYYTRAFDSYDGLVIATEKIHGTNFRAGWVPYNTYNLWRKFLNWIGKPIDKWQWEFAWGSRRVQLTLKGKKHQTFYDQNVYYKIKERYNLKKKLSKGEVIYGEIYGYGIQKNYTYSLDEGEHRCVFFDLMKDGEYQDWDDLFQLCRSKALPIPPIVFCGTYNAEAIKKVANSEASWMDPGTKPIEGIVLKPVVETKGYMGRMVFKLISDEYWLNKDNSDFH
jgi:RNA ligase (TIGR02306 family)